ncbi:uncharacterized protein LOC133202871 [Saccostrea echinata]|uniref:uncharacterized protein LOC133202871 n=1 Tax=Saccostrea echinata TaxID=191078 RepID=UPI002A7FA127|nr:uncharacterized protein LOC133202871 [Saccostrea echinata]
MEHISEAMYFGLWRFLGTNEMVAMRRDVIDLRDVIENELRSDGYRQMFSGSRREGFRMMESDIDIMYWPTDHKLISKLSQATHYESTNHALILMESDYCPPGFVLLRLLNDSRRQDVFSACININGKLYISSSRHREVMCFGNGKSGFVPHGPCISGAAGIFEFDQAYCFMSDFWPIQASSWIGRCFKQLWPSITTLNKIVKNGCHAVAIGSKSSLYESIEWRISFSQAEHKLIYSLNHCQFLCYGLLKLFLKEVINNNTQDKLLCSYHIKTILFWVIQENCTPVWCRQNFIQCFWTCFETLCKYVYHGVCPNFFIPQNNMFRGKIHGNSQFNLHNHLMKIHRNGPLCLLLSPSIGGFLQKFGSILTSPLRFEVTLPLAVFDDEYFTELFFATLLQVTDFNISIKCYETMENMLRKKNNLTIYQKNFLQICLSECFQYNAFMIKACLKDGCNRIKYKYDKISCSLLKLAGKLGFLSTILYVALFHYATHRYTEAVRVLEDLKTKMSQSSLLYHKSVDTRAYEEAVKGLPWSVRIRKNAVAVLKFDNNLFYMEELRLEQKICLKNHMPGLFIPPFVMLHFLLVLCYRKANPGKASSALDDLSVLVHYDENRLVLKELRDISWQILGICQQISGHFEDALFSYNKVFEQIPVHKIHEAAKIRIGRFNQNNVYEF